MILVIFLVLGGTGLAVVIIFQEMKIRCLEERNKVLSELNVPDFDAMLDSEEEIVLDPLPELPELDDTDPFLPQGFADKNVVWFDPGRRAKRQGGRPL